MSSRARPRPGRPSLSEYEKTVLFTMRVPKSLRDQLKTVPAAVKREMLARAVERVRNEGLLNDQAAQGQAQGPSTPAGQPQGAQADRKTAGPADPESLFIE